ncbi:MAG: ABC transporter permease [Candidatus Heimdallarchaeota archaeon]|nr:ABC transporter permease [Candidatus Heimdallarchaeota archaeon]
MVMKIIDIIVESTQSIYRNKRRSMAMVAGIILGITILSGIIIYSSVLQQENFDSIIGSAQYEVSFSVIETTSDESTLWEVGQTLADDIRVESYTVITGSSSGGFFGGAVPTFSITLSTELENIAEDEDFAFTSFTPQFVRDNFTRTTIYDKLTENEFVGTFDLAAVNTNKTVIPQIVSSRLNLQVGDIIDHINLTISEEGEARDGPGSGPGGITNREYEMITIDNVEITGIYTTADSNAGLFSNFESSIFYFSTNFLDDYGQAASDLIRQNKDYFLAVKIDTEQFTVSDVDILNEEIDLFINDIAELTSDPVSKDDIIVGSNEISVLLAPFSILNIFLVVFDVILVIPIIILCLYLLSFGLQLALEERRREIGIFKVQGASATQIFSLIRNEAFMLFIFGTVIGYVLSILGAWVIGSSIGFMNFNISSLGEFGDFITFDMIALLVSSILIFSILLISIYKRGREFINMEVSEAVQRGAVKKVGFFTRNNLDIVMVAFGLLSSVIMIIDEETTWFETINFDPTSALYTILIRIFGTVFLWAGAALSGARVAKWLPQKSERAFLSLPKLRNVGLIIRSGLKRRGDIDKLVLIIVLTLSITTLSGIQGMTEQSQAERVIDYQIGSDFKITFANEGNYTADVQAIDGVSTVMELPMTSVDILSQSSTFYGMDPNHASSLLWHEDGFDEVSLDDALTDFSSTSDIPEILMGETLARVTRTEISDEISLKVTLDNPDINASDVARLKVRVIGFFDHAPGSIGSSAIVGSHDTINQLIALQANTSILYNNEIPSYTYLVKAVSNANTDQMEEDFSKLDGYSEIRNLEREYSEIGLSGTYGFPGLLTMMYLTSFATALVSAFAFSAIIMERRKREFAVLQTVGSTSSQVYTVAFGENFLIMLTSVIWGTISGLGLSYLMNGFFSFIADILGIGGLPRVVTIDWLSLAFNGSLILAGMLIATLFSVRSSVNQDLTEATRTI